MRRRVHDAERMLLRRRCSRLSASLSGPPDRFVAGALDQRERTVSRRTAPIARQTDHRTIPATGRRSRRRGRSPSSPPWPASGWTPSASSTPQGRAACQTPTARSSPSGRCSPYSADEVERRPGRRRRQTPDDVAALDVGEGATADCPARQPRPYSPTGDGQWVGRWRASSAPRAIRGDGTAMKHPVTTLAEGLGHPEGPDVLPDGRIVFVETYTSKVLAWSEERGIHDYVDCGGGPNACLLGAAGELYITQNGGTVGAWRAEVMRRPSIQKPGRMGASRGRRRGRRHPPAGPQRPDLRAGRATVLHGSRRLPAERSQAGADLPAGTRRQRRPHRGGPRRVSERHHHRGRRRDRLGRVVRARGVSQAR